MYNGEDTVFEISIKTPRSHVHYMMATSRYNDHFDAYADKCNDLHRKYRDAASDLANRMNGFVGLMMQEKKVMREKKVA